MVTIKSLEKKLQVVALKCMFSAHDMIWKKMYGKYIV